MVLCTVLKHTFWVMISYYSLGAVSDSQQLAALPGRRRFCIRSGAFITPRAHAQQGVKQSSVVIVLVVVAVVVVVGMKIARSEDLGI